MRSPEERSRPAALAASVLRIRPSPCRASRPIPSRIRAKGLGSPGGGVRGSGALEAGVERARAPRGAGAECGPRRGGSMWPSRSLRPRRAEVASRPSAERVRRASARARSPSARQPSAPSRFSSRAIASTRGRAGGWPTTSRARSARRFLEGDPVEVVALDQRALVVGAAGDRGADPLCHLGAPDGLLGSGRRRPPAPGPPSAAPGSPRPSPWPCRTTSPTACRRPLAAWRAAASTSPRRRPPGRDRRPPAPGARGRRAAGRRPARGSRRASRRGCAGWPSGGKGRRDRRRNSSPPRGGPRARATPARRPPGACRAGGGLGGR